MQVAAEARREKVFQVAATAAAQEKADAEVEAARDLATSAQLVAEEKEQEAERLARAKEQEEAAVEEDRYSKAWAGRRQQQRQLQEVLDQAR